MYMGASIGALLVYKGYIMKYIDSTVKKGIRKAILAGAESKGIDLSKIMTSNVESKLDSLVQAIIDDAGYVELTKIGLKVVLNENR